MHRTGGQLPTGSEPVPCQCQQGTFCCRPLSYEPWLHGPCIPFEVAGALGSCHYQLGAMPRLCLSFALYWRQAKQTAVTLLVPLAGMLCSWPEATRPMQLSLPQLLQDVQCWMCIYGWARGKLCTPHVLYLCLASRVHLAAWVCGLAMQALLPHQAHRPIVCLSSADGGSDVLSEREAVAPL